jgi:hypothetical protein
MGRHIYSGYSDHHDDGDDPYGQASGNGHKPIHIFDRGRLLRSSFDGKRSTVRDRRNYPHARGFSRCRRELTDDAVGVINPDELPGWTDVRVGSKCEMLIPIGCLPLCPRQQTCGDCAALTVSCQERT